MKVLTQEEIDLIRELLGNQADDDAEGDAEEREHGDKCAALLEKLEGNLSTLEFPRRAGGTQN